MQMTKEEIIRHYRQAKNKEDDIQILAELNVTTTDEIRATLIEGGAMRREYKRKPRTETEKAEMETQVKPDKSEDIYQRLETILDSIPSGADGDIKECAFNLCFAVYVDYLRNRLEM